MKKFSDLFEGRGMPASATGKERFHAHLQDVEDHLEALQAHVDHLRLHSKADHRAADHLHHLSGELSKLNGHARHHNVVSNRG